MRGRAGEGREGYFASDGESLESGRERGSGWGHWGRFKWRQVDAARLSDLLDNSEVRVHARARGEIVG